MGKRLSKTQAAHLQELGSLIRKANNIQKVNGTTVYLTSKRELTNLLRFLKEHYPLYPEAGKLEYNAWQRMGKWIHDTPRAPAPILTTWKAVMAMITLLYKKDRSDKNLDIPPPPYEAAAQYEPAALMIDKSPTPSSPPSSPPVTAPMMTALAAGLQKARQEGDLQLEDLQVFPVTLIPDPNNPGQQIRGIIPVDYKMVKSLKEAVEHYGISSPYCQGLVRAYANSFELVPDDWKTLSQVLLTNSQQIMFDHFWRRAVQAAQNGNTIPQNVTADQLLGNNLFATPQQQLASPRAMFPFLNGIILEVFAKLEDGKDVRSSFAGIKQGAREPYADFVDRLTKAIAKQISNVAARTELATKLAFENANEDCRQLLKSVVVIPEAGIPEFIEACRTVGTTAYEMKVLAATLNQRNCQAGPSQGQQRSQAPCFNCGRTGHFKAQCRAPGGGAAPGRDGRVNKPKTVCPKCKLGYHWARDCRKFPAQQSGNQGN